MKVSRNELESRVKTGILGLDELIEGGLIKNSTVLLRGRAGTGKTIFALHFLVYGAMNGEPGVFLSIEESKRDLYREGKKFGWDLDSLEKDEKLTIIERQSSYSITVLELERAAKRIGAKRAVVDSIPAMFTSYPNELQVLEMRSAFYMLCKVLTESCNCTTILITESNWTNNAPFEEYVPKGVIELSSKIMEGVSRKFLMIRKMREMRHSKSLHLYEITNKGFTLYRPKMNQMGDM